MKQKQNKCLYKTASDISFGNKTHEYAFKAGK